MFSRTVPPKDLITFVKNPTRITCNEARGLYAAKKLNSTINTLSLVCGFHPIIRNTIDGPSRIINRGWKKILKETSKTTEQSPLMQMTLQAFGNKNEGTLLGTKTGIRTSMRIASLTDLECLIDKLNNSTTLKIAEEYEKTKQPLWDKHVNTITKERLKVKLDNSVDLSILKKYIQISSLKTDSKSIDFLSKLDPSKKEISDIVDHIFTTDQKSTSKHIETLRHLYKKLFEDIIQIKQKGDKVITDTKTMLLRSKDKCETEILASVIKHAIEAFGWILFTHFILNNTISPMLTGSDSSIANGTLSMGIKGAVGHILNRQFLVYSRITDIESHDFLKYAAKEFMYKLFSKDEDYPIVKHTLGVISGSHITARNMLYHLSQECHHRLNTIGVNELDIIGAINNVTEILDLNGIHPTQLFVM